MQIIHGDCLEVLRSLPEHSVDAIVSDPPAGINFMNMAFDSDRGGRDTWIAWLADIMQEARRVIRPGGHAFIWALPRTSHWTALALEDAGWEIREKTYHIFASGFPKSHSISKAIDKMRGAEREVIGAGQYASRRPRPYIGGNAYEISKHVRPSPLETAPATPEAAQWDGWGTATKPAVEEWILARAPLSEKNIAENVLKHGTGGLNIDDTRVGTAADMNPRDFDDTRRTSPKFSGILNGGKPGEYRTRTGTVPNGRFPSNFLLSHSLFCTEEQCIEDCPVMALDRQSGVSKDRLHLRHNAAGKQGYGIDNRPFTTSGYGDQGGASRYFQTFYYCPKPSKRERNAGCEELPEKYNDFQRITSGLNQDRPNREGRKPMGPQSNHHPTVKPAQLMQYLCRLITPSGGTVLDPFAGSGTTGVACVHEGFNFIGIERESEYVDIALARIEHALKLHAE